MPISNPRLTTSVPKFRRSALAIFLPLLLLLQVVAIAPSAATEVNHGSVDSGSVIASEAPAGLKITEADPFGIKLSWNPWNSAPRYRIQFSTSSDMADAVYYRYTTTTADIRGLTPGTTYYFRVSAISADGATSLSPYSNAVVGKTPAASSGATPGPTGLVSTAQSSVSINIAWKSWENAPRYRVQYATDASMAGAVYNRFYTTSADIRGLKPNTTYHFRVAAISEDGSETLSDYSAPLSVRTKAAVANLPAVVNPLSVATYNVKCANCFAGAPNELPWAERRSAVVATIKSRMPDILGLQEASQGWLANESREGGLAQFEDLQERLNASGAAYRLTNDKRNNCVKHTTPTNCVYQDQGASQGTKILFNTQTTEMISAGSTALPSFSGEDNSRFMAWGVFRQKATGKRVFVANTHLQLGGGSEYQDLRNRQSEAIVAEITAKNTEGLPVLITGDLNSHKFTDPSNVPYDVFTGAGYVDPLGNTYATDLPSGGATAEKRTGAFYDSFNAFKRKANARNPEGNGNYLDYIFTSRMRVSEWETVVKVDSNGNFIGVIPSDHNMIVADVDLPGSATSSPEPPSFTDVPQGTQFHKEIGWLASEGISTGWTERNGTKTFRPLQAVNRDAMAAFMYRASGSPAFNPPSRSPFADVSTTNVFYKEIAWLASTGVSTGWTEANGSKTYRPLLPVNRNAMAAFMYRLAGSPSYSAPATSSFSDISRSEQFYKEMSWLAANDISTGWTSSRGLNTFRALQPVNRDAMAAFMYRYDSRF